MRQVTRLPAVTLLLIGAAACNSDQKPAEEAVARAERFVAAMQTEGMKVLPEPTKRLGDSVKMAKQQLAAKDYRGARATAVAVAGRAVEVAKLVEPKRHELDSTYKVISFEVTWPVRNIVAKAKELTSAGRVPKGMTKAGFDSLKKDVATWEDIWKSATENKQKGEIGVAAAQAQDLRKRVIEAQKVLGLLGKKRS